MASFLEENRPFAVVTVIMAHGSTPLPAGARALVEPSGVIHGTVGGGAVEAAAIRFACDALQTQQVIVFDFDLHGSGPPNPDPICGGRMRLVVDPNPWAAENELHKVLLALDRRERGWWVTQLNESSPWQVQSAFLPNGEPAPLPAPPPSALQEECMRGGKALYLPAVAGQRGEMLMEPLLPIPRLVMVGGGHVGQAVAAQAALLGFEVIVVEDRPEFAQPDLFPPHVRTECGNIEEILRNMPMDRDTSIVLATRGHSKDAEALRACIHREMGYLGMIGSRRKVPLMRKMFIERGWATEEQWAKLYAPIGLDIGAVSVQEIATAIMAQIIAVRRKGSAPRIPLSFEP